jgi:hypothetical protein
MDNETERKCSEENTWPIMSGIRLMARHFEVPVITLSAVLSALTHATDQPDIIQEANYFLHPFCGLCPRANYTD